MSKRACGYYEQAIRLLRLLKAASSSLPPFVGRRACGRASPKIRCRCCGGWKKKGASEAAAQIRGQLRRVPWAPKGKNMSGRGCCRNGDDRGVRGGCLVVGLTWSSCCGQFVRRQLPIGKRRLRVLWYAVRRTVRGHTAGSYPEGKGGDEE